VKQVRFDSVESEIIKLLQSDLPLESRPYQLLSEKLGISEEEIVARINILQEKGLIRRLGAVLRHQQVGYTVNAMVAWKTDESRVDEVGKVIAGYSSVSHCYLRQVPKEFEYNLFSMIHSRSEEELVQILKRIADRTGVQDYVVIRSIRELKKVSMTYI